MQLGMIGLGRMGGNMTTRLARARPRGARRTTRGVELDRGDRSRSCATSSSAPRAFWMMVPAGKITEDDVPGAARARRARATRSSTAATRTSATRSGATREAQAKHGIQFVDAGVSGGVWGLEDGYCLMVGGDDEPVRGSSRSSRDLAPEDGYAHVGASGAGHFTKMVHNGIEYGLMQAYAEGFEVMEKSEFDARPARDRRHLALRLGRPLVAARAAARGVREGRRRAGEDPGYVEDSGEGRWTIPRRSPRTCRCR